MTHTDIARGAVALLLTSVLGWAAFSDIRARKIPNWTVLAVIGLFIPWAFVSGSAWVLWALAAGGLALLISFTLYTLNLIGAGDSKLFSAAALFAGLGHLAELAFITAMAGAVIALASLVSRPYRAMAMFTLRGKGDFGPGVPYGVAIAIGAAVVVWSVALKLPFPSRF